MSTTKIVKRYANRKLYDTERSCYVTLEDIAVMIRAGDEVRVIDNKSGEDLTSVTLAQIIFETEKKNNFMPLSLLRGLIQDGGDALGEIAAQGVGAVQAKANEVKEGALKLRSEFENRLERVGRSNADGTPNADSRPKALAELIAQAFEELQKRVDENLKGPVGTMTRYASLGTEMEDIRSRLAELEQRLEQFPQ